MTTLAPRALRLTATVLLAAAALGTLAGLSPESTPAAPAAPAAPAPQESAFVLDHAVKTIDGTDANLAQYKGQVVLIVNVASKCGFTAQYDGLQKLFQSRKDKGLVVLGFPSNDFGGQEPGTNAEIAQFCSSKFGVDFPMFEKIAVTGPDAHPLYKDLASQPAPIGGAPKWNFTKFLVDRNGRVVARFDSRVRPDAAELTQKVDELLAAAPAK